MKELKVLVELNRAFLLEAKGLTGEISKPELSASLNSFIDGVNTKWNDTWSTY